VRLDPAQRFQFLEQACAGDETLRQELDSLLAQEERAQRFLERPALETVTASLARSEELPAGLPIGPYRIIEPLGAGGMGEVYSATDTRLERTVAIKLLSPGVSGTGYEIPKLHGNGDGSLPALLA